MQIDNINLNNLRVFECVYKTRSMSLAAKELHLTQSGVSQHIKTLEQSLGTRLFDRINKKLLPTEAGDRLFGRAEPALNSLEQALVQLVENPNEIKGALRIGMPTEFGINIVIPLLSRIGREHEGLNFDIRLDFASSMNQMLLEGQLDFAFVDDYTMDKRIRVEKVADEIFYFVASREYLKSKGTTLLSKTYFEDLDYVSYQPGEPVLRNWFGFHLKRRGLSLKVKAQIMDVTGVARFITNGLGAGVLPDHKVKKLLNEGYDLHIFEGCGKELKNSMSLAYLEGRSIPKHVQFVMDQMRQVLRA